MKLSLAFLSLAFMFVKQCLYIHGLCKSITKKNMKKNFIFSLLNIIAYAKGFYYLNKNKKIHAELCFSIASIET